MNTTFSANSSSVNVTSSLGARSPDYSIPAWFAVFVALNGFGAFGNILLFVIIVSEKTLRKGAGVLVMHFLLIYASLGAVHYPVFGAVLYETRVLGWTVSKDACSAVTFFQIATSFAANWADTAVAFNRLVAVFGPHFYNTIISKSALAGHIIAVWVISITLALPPCFGSGGVYTLLPVGTCGFLPLGRAGAVILAVGIYLPLALVGFCYAALFSRVAFTKICRLTRVTRDPTPADTAMARRVRQRTALAKSLFASFLWYCFCYLPAPLMNSIDQKTYLKPLVFLWLRTMFACGSAISPFILLSLHERYRKALRDTIPGVKRISKPITDASLPSRNRGGLGTGTLAQRRMSRLPSSGS